MHVLCSAVTARSKLEAAIHSLLLVASSKQASVLQQMQADLLTMLELVVLPELRPGVVATGATLSAVSRIIRGVCSAACQSSLRALNNSPSSELVAVAGLECR